MPEPRRQISERRKALYYLGGILMVVGFLLFFSTFASAACHFGDFTDFESRGRSMAMRAFGGMFLLIVGVILRGIGAAGLAGSGVILDPQEARKDLEPWNRMAGGMASDALSEVEPVQRLVDKLTEDAPPPDQVVKVRCRSCGALNDEDARFCDQCSAQL